MTVSIVIPYFGDLDAWRPYLNRAIDSAVAQSVDCDIVVANGDTLHEARNEGAERAQGEWLVFLDADDELDAGYVAAMLAGGGDLRQPATLTIARGVEDPAPVLTRRKPLLEGNTIVIGAMHRRDLFMEVGGFRDLPAYEDWDLWIRCWLAGAEITSCPDAVYRVHIRPGSRNQLSNNQAVRLFRTIVKTYQRKAEEMQLA